MMKWNGNAEPTLGVEQEFHLVDPETGALSGRMEAVWECLAGRMRELACYELFLSCLEMRSAVGGTVDELVARAGEARAAAAEAARGCGVRLAAAGTHPFADWREEELAPTEHYRWVDEHHGYLSQRLLAWGLHVHVGMRTADGAVYAMHELKRWLYPLLALSANSPFFEGRLTRLASTRMHLMSSMPRTLWPPSSGSWVEFEGRYETLKAAGDVTRPGDLWWAVRPQPPLGTVEVRVLDLPTRPDRVGVLAALVQAALAHYQERYEAGAAPTALDEGWLDENRWKAMRYGLDARMVDAATGEVVEMREQLARLMALVGPAAERLGGGAWLERARAAVAEGSEAEWQVAEAERQGGDLRRLELSVAERTTAGL
jgi:carboxylate-amine ligase